MTAFRLRARYDGKVFQPDGPVNLPPNTSTFLTVVVPGQDETHATDRDDVWDELAAAAFAEAAYAGDEPEYGPEDLIKE